MSLCKRLAAEILGTFWLVFGGCGSAVLAAAFPQVGIGLLGVSLAFGLTVLTMAYAIGHISGCHLNPAVTVGLAAGRRFPWNEVIPYAIAQVVGAVVASAVLYIIASGVFRMRERPFIIGGLLIIAGYYGAWLEGVPQYDDLEFRKKLHQWQLARLKLGWLAPK